MFLHRVLSTHGRLIPKPKKEGEIEELVEENVPIQDQIENLRTKIALKERYNRVLSETLQESQKGTTNVIQDLYYETRELRIQLMDALTSEQAAVQNALRSHRKFQLAMTNRGPGIAIPWLEDKFCDDKSKLNCLLDRLNAKRQRLEEAEQLVILIEKWPRPGSLPWEIETAKGFEQLESMIEEYKIKRETSSILHTNYHTIKMLLHEEKGKYAPTLRNMENQLKILKNEYDSLNRMKDEAYLFYNDAEKEVGVTEKEASENRKFRRKQMNKIKKSVEKVLAENQLFNPSESGVRTKLRPKMSSSVFVSHIQEMIKAKKEEVAVYQNEARRLVEIMRVPDLTFIPKRLKTVQKLGETLRAELDSKEKVQKFMLKQKNQMTLLKYHFLYTGFKAEADFNIKKTEYKEALTHVDTELEQATHNLYTCGDLIVNLRLGVIALLERLEPEKDQPTTPGFKKAHGVFHEPDLKSQIKLVLEKVKKLAKIVESYETLFANQDAEHNYAQYVKPIAVPDRLIKVGSPVLSEESEEEDIPDSKVPNRIDIKQKSQKIIQLAILKRGLS